MKRCSTCGELKFLDQFPKDRSKRDGLFHSCRVCAYRKYKSREERLLNHIPEVLVINGETYIKESSIKF